MAEREPNIGASVQEISEKAQLLVREEIELAKTEVAEKVKSLARGAAVGAAAGVFAFFGLILLLFGFAFLTDHVLAIGPGATFFWGFFLVAGLLFLLGGLAGLLAYRAVKAGTPPKPQMAIDEAQRIKQTVQEARR